MIKPEELARGHIYEVDGLELRIAVWDGEKFVGPKLTNGVVTMVTESHYLKGLPDGTATPTRKLDMPAVVVNHGLLVGLAAAQEIIELREG